MGILQNNRAFFIFLVKFGLSYLLLSGAYWLYLSQFDAAKPEADGITHLVARQAEWLVNLAGEDAHIAPHKSVPAYRFWIHGRPVARIVEGCNAVSVMILFVAFIVAFSTTFKRTALYIFAGVVLIHILNVIRIALLTAGVYYYPDYSAVFHDIVFPLFIYGVVFILWVLWVLKFSGHAKKTQA